MEKSIEEDIKILEGLRIANENCIKIAKITDNPFVAIWEKQNRAIEHILSDYKRVLKENEEKTTILLAGAEKVKKLEKENKKLKEDRNNNNEMVALARNEVLNYMTGYEDGKKHKITATAQVVENQQYYIIQKQMEKYEEHIKRLQKENEELKLKERRKIIGKYGDVEIHDVINRTLSNDYIPTQKIKDIIDRIDYDIKKTKEIIAKNTNVHATYRKNEYQIVRLRAMNTKSLDIKKRLQKLLESEEK